MVSRQLYPSLQLSAQIRSNGDEVDNWTEASSVLVPSTHRHHYALTWCVLLTIHDQHTSPVTTHHSGSDRQCQSFKLRPPGPTVVAHVIVEYPAGVICRTQTAYPLSRRFFSEPECIKVSPTLSRRNPSTSPTSSGSILTRKVTFNFSRTSLHSHGWGCEGPCLQPLPSHMAHDLVSPSSGEYMWKGTHVFPFGQSLALQVFAIALRLSARRGAPVN